MNLIGIDSGSAKSGVAIVTNGEIERGMVIPNDILLEPNFFVPVE